MKFKTEILKVGSDGYQDEAVFNVRGVAVRYLGFIHPIYPQRGRQDIVAGLSIIGAVMNLVWTGVRTLMQWSHRHYVVNTDTGVSALVSDLQT